MTALPFYNLLSVVDDIISTPVPKTTVFDLAVKKSVLKILNKNIIFEIIAR
jgi:hypothetical protein